MPFGAGRRKHSACVHHDQRQVPTIRLVRGPGQRQSMVGVGLHADNDRAAASGRCRHTRYRSLLGSETGLAGRRPASRPSAPLIASA